MSKTPAVLAKTPIGGEYESEAAFRRHLRYRARALGWLLYEVPDSRRVHSSGFPDLVLCHPVLLRLAFIEAKTDVGRFSNEQSEWLGALAHAGIEYVVEVWRPRMADQINRYLETGD